MTKILAVGLGPLLAPGTRYLGGQCLRTWHFVRPLLEAGHIVKLVTCPVDADLPSERASRVGDGVEALDFEGFSYLSFRHRSLEDQIWNLRNLLRDEPFEAIVAVNAYAGELAAHLGARLPLWADLNGWGMAEAQAKAAGLQSDEGLRWSWRQEKAVALRADRFSTVSRAQRAALLGELAALGRLNAENFGIELVHPVPNAAAPLHLEVGKRRIENGGPLPPPEVGPVPAGAPIVLWAGGFNYWTDEAKVFAALEKTLSAHEAAHVVVTGGPIHGYGDEVYARFEERVRGSALVGRFHLMGWLPGEEMLAWFAAATAGLNFDVPSLEAEFGARNRLTNMAASAVAPVTTRGAEVVADLEARDAGWFVAPGDADGLAAALSAAVSQPGEAWRRACAAREAAVELYTDSVTVTPLLEWAADPIFAPDNERKLAEAPPGDTAWSQRPVNALQTEEWPALHEDLSALRTDSANLARLRAKWPLRLWRRLRGRR